MFQRAHQCTHYFLWTDQNRRIRGLTSWPNNKQLKWAIGQEEWFSGQTICQHIIHSRNLYLCHNLASQLYKLGTFIKIIICRCCLASTHLTENWIWSHINSTNTSPETCTQIRCQNNTILLFIWWFRRNLA
jgi:hypothetical protein